MSSLHSIVDIFNASAKMWILTLLHNGQNYVKIGLFFNLSFLTRTPNFSPKYLENLLSKNQTKLCDESIAIHNHCYHKGKWNAAQHFWTPERTCGVLESQPRNTNPGMFPIFVCL